MNGNERVKLTNCTFDEVKLVDWEANKLEKKVFHLHLQQPKCWIQSTIRRRKRMNLIDKLLSVDKEELTKECTKTYHSKNMERLTGDGEITLRKVKERKLRERALNTLDKKGNLLLVNAHDSDLLVLMDGVKNQT